MREIAVVTGGGQGIGGGIARRLAADGYDVVILDRQEEPAQSLAASIGGKAVQCDVTDPDAVRAAAAAIGPVAVLVNNAGIAFIEDMLSSTEPNMRAVVDVNLMGVVHCCRAFAPGMIGQARGSIVNISSGSVLDATPGYNLVPATKAAVELLTRQLAMEWGPSGVRVNAIGPGAIQTEKNADRFAGDRLSHRLNLIPLRRAGVPADIAGAISALCSADMAYVTGQVIYVDGGLSVGKPGV